MADPSSSSSPPPFDTTTTANSTTVAAPRRPKSPPLAFEKTPNDALVPRIAQPPTDGELPKSPPDDIMGRLNSLSVSESPLALRAIVDKQHAVIQGLHRQFAQEKELWDLERQRFNSRIFSLEQLLRNGEHHSPAKSPVLSPFHEPEILSAQTRASISSSSLPTIAEDGNTTSLSWRRDGAPRSIDIPSIGLHGEERRRSSVTYKDSNGFQVEEIPAPSVRTEGLSPPPPNNRMMAGHTPVRVPRPPTPPPQNMTMDGIEDTPTRNNTHINTLLTQSSDEEEDVALQGPLNLPELPNEPDATNFSLDALTHRLQHIEQHPDQSKPLVFSQPSPGLASPVSEREDDSISPTSKAIGIEAPFAPVSTVANLSQAIASPAGQTISPQEAHEAKVQKDFEAGGIKLKKKASTNFGLPYGSIAGLPIVRKTSHDEH